MMAYSILTPVRFCSLQEHKGITALCVAAGMGKNDIVKIFLENGADVDKVTEDGETSLLFASQNGHLNVVKYLVEEGKAEVDKAKNDGQAPLYVASGKGHLEIMKCLVEEGEVDVDKARDTGATTLCAASANGHLKVVKVLVEAGNADLNKALPMAILSGKEEMSTT